MWSVPFSVWRLMVAYALMMSGTALTVLIAGIIGTDFAPTPKLATLPFALAIIGVAASTLPTGFLQRRFGRRAAFLAAGVLAIASALLAAGSLVAQSFAAFCLATFAMGWAAAAAHQYRFAALELVPATMAPKATSVLLLGGIVGAFIGPEMAVRGRYMVSTEYAGSYLLLAVGYVCAMVLLGFYKERHYDEEAEVCGGRPLLQVLRHPITILAISSAAVAYGDYKSFGSLTQAAESLGVTIKKAGLQRVPNSPVEFSEEQIEEIEKLIDQLEEDEDVQAVYNNIA